MKYPQLVSMPSSVQDWLDEQLEARGIDAVVYTRYIFSLLQRDTLDLPDDLLSLSCNKGKEFGRRGRKRGRREEYWDVLDCEQLKRFAAVECLMSASDQKFGIEKLVDELCAKLKEIQSEESGIQDSLHETSTSKKVNSTQSQTSPHDQAQKYYAAFPPLGRPNETSCNSAVLTVDEYSVWGSKKVLANSFGKNKPQAAIFDLFKELEFKKSVEDKENQGSVSGVSWKEISKGNMRSRNQVKERVGVCKEKLSYGFAWNMEEGANRECSDRNGIGLTDRNAIDGCRVSKYNRQNREVSDNLIKRYSSSKVDSGSWNISDCRRLYERQSEVLHQLNMNNENRESGSYEETSGSCVDENLAQLIAKFDESIEALWNPDKLDDLSVKHEDELHSSLDFFPVKEKPNATSDSYNLSNKTSSSCQDIGNSFIQCGTNITSSIWSSQPHFKPLESEGCIMQKYMEEQKNKSEFIEELDQSRHICKGLQNVEQFENLFEGSVIAAGNRSDLTKSDSKINAKTGCQLRTLDHTKTTEHIAEGKVVGSKCVLSGPVGTGRNDNSFRRFHTLEHIGPFIGLTQDDNKISWSKCQNFLPSLFSSLPITEDDFIPEEADKSDCHRKWANIGCYNNTVGNSSDYNMFSGCSKPYSFSVFSDNGSASFSALNHNKEDSSFIEVIPKQALCDLVPNSNMPLDLQCDLTRKSTESVYFAECDDGKINKVTENAKDTEEEDLLTSTRTHFRPIRQENSDYQNNHTGYYADGTTFVIPNSFESIPFKRSESGIFYLEEDVGIETPKMYMEYKEKEPYGGCRKNGRSPDFTNATVNKEFVPKFRVNQIEKYCQTEDAEEISDEEVDPKRSRQEVIDSNSEFYFPGDEHVAEKINFSENEYTDQEVEQKPISKNASCNNIVDCFEESSEKSDKQCYNSRFVGGKQTGLDDISERWSAAVKSCCKCNRNNNLAVWKSGWLKGSFGFGTPKAGIWETPGSALHLQSWYDIWSGTENEDTDPCQKCGTMGIDRNKNPSPQQRKLREELSQDGEQLLSDLSYLQHLYLGSSSNELGAGCEEKVQCLSPPPETTSDVQLYDSGFAGGGSSQLHKSGKKDIHGNESELFEDFVSTCSPRTLPIKILLSMELEAEKKLNERPFNTKATPKDRKRRHSGSQRPSSYNRQVAEAYSAGPPGACEASTVACRLWAVADLSHLKGARIPRSLRPVTL